MIGSQNAVLSLSLIVIFNIFSNHESRFLAALSCRFPLQTFSLDMTCVRLMRFQDLAGSLFLVLAGSGFLLVLGFFWILLVLCSWFLLVSGSCWFLVVAGRGVLFFFGSISGSCASLCLLLSLVFLSCPLFCLGVVGSCNLSISS